LRRGVFRGAMTAQQQIPRHSVDRSFGPGDLTGRTSVQVAQAGRSAG
jgi:hypothetical protein